MLLFSRVRGSLVDLDKKIFQKKIVLLPCSSSLTTDLVKILTQIIFDVLENFFWGPRDVGTKGPRDVGKGPRDVGKGPRDVGKGPRDVGKRSERCW